MRTISLQTATASAVIFAMFVLTSPSVGADATSFETPQYWSVGDAYSTYHGWDLLTAAAGNTPDVGHVTTPSGLTASALSVVSPGFLAGSGNFYSFSGDYGVAATIFNHGGSSGSGAPVDYGTHVIIQTAATMNSDTNASVYADSLRLVTPLGGSILEGDNPSRLRFEELWVGDVTSAFGTVTQQELVWEFFLPNYTGDFEILADVAIHSSFMEMRVDTMLAPQAIPEPATLAMLGCGGIMLLRRRLTRR